MRPPLPFLILSTTLFLTVPAAAQEAPAWRKQVDRLLDRWSDDVGSARVERALNLLEEHLKRKRNRKDGEALLEKARLLLSRPKPQTVDPHQGATLAAASYHLAGSTADLAASYLQGERNHQAQALACLALNLQLRAELERMELIPGNPQTRKLLSERSGAIQRRRGALAAACGGEEAATALIAQETQRISYLRSVDQLGTFPRPIGMDDVSGKPVDLTTYYGKVLLIVFWSSALGDAEVLSEIQALREKLADEGIEVLAVNLDDSREAMDAAVATLKLDWRQCFDGAGIAGKTARAWSIRSMPDGVLIDRTGRVRYVAPWRGNLEQAVQDLLKRTVSKTD